MYTWSEELQSYVNERGEAVSNDEIIAYMEHLDEMLHKQLMAELEDEGE